MKLELLQNVFDQVPGYLDTVSQSVGSMSLVTKITVIFIPILIAGLSRHIITFLAVLLLSAMTLSILAAPAFATTIVMLGAYIGALLVALAGVGFRRRRKAYQAEVETLKASLAEFADAEQHRFLMQLKSQGKANENE